MGTIVLLPRITLLCGIKYKVPDLVWGLAHDMHLMSAIFVAVVDIKFITLVTHVAQCQDGMSDDRKVNFRKPRVLYLLSSTGKGGCVFLAHQSDSLCVSPLSSRRFPLPSVTLLTASTCHCW